MFFADSEPECCRHSRIFIHVVGLRSAGVCNQQFLHWYELRSGTKRDVPFDGGIRSTSHIPRIFVLFIWLKYELFWYTAMNSEKALQLQETVIFMSLPKHPGRIAALEFLTCCFQLRYSIKFISLQRLTCWRMWNQRPLSVTLPWAKTLIPPGFLTGVLVACVTTQAAAQLGCQCTFSQLHSCLRQANYSFGFVSGMSKPSIYKPN